jgi:PAS domain S-box-containing protein
VNHVLDKKRKEKEYAATLKALKESEERFRLLFDNSMDAVLLTQPDGSINKANPAACKIFGKSEEQIIREGRNGIVDLTDPRLEIALKQRAINGSFLGELTGIRNNGERFPIEVSSTLFIDKNGKQNSSMIIRDISERKTNEEEINKKLSQFERFHQLTIDRELMMIELKKEVNDLLQKLGLPKKYN